MEKHKQLTYARTPEHRIKMSAIQKQVWANPESRKKLSNSLKGRKFTAEWIAKLSIAVKNRTPEHQAKLSAAAKNRKFTPEHRAKLSANTKKHWQIGAFSTDEYRAKLSAA